MRRPQQASGSRSHSSEPWSTACSATRAARPQRLDRDAQALDQPVAHVVRLGEEQARVDLDDAHVEAPALAIRCTSTLEVRCHEQVSTMRPGNRSAARRMISAALASASAVASSSASAAETGAAKLDMHPHPTNDPLRRLMAPISKHCHQRRDPAGSARRLEAASEQVSRSRQADGSDGLSRRAAGATTCTSRSPARGRTARSSSGA